MTKITITITNDNHHDDNKTTTSTAQKKVKGQGDYSAHKSSIISR